jgi:hypothetical protein
MTTKKKSRPLFEVPAEVESGAQSGWVYRSGAEEESGPAPAMVFDVVDSSVAAASAATIALAFATFAQGLALGMTIAALPWTMGLRTIKHFTKQ